MQIRRREFEGFPPPRRRLWRPLRAKKTNIKKEGAVGAAVPPLLGVLVKLV